MTIKDRLASWFLRWLMKNRPEELRRAVKASVDEQVQSVALQTTMMYLDRMGFVHCALCPQRFGLRRSAVSDGSARTREIYLCTAHYSEVHQLAASNGDGTMHTLEAL